MLNFSYYDGLDPVLLKNKKYDNTNLHLQNEPSISKLTNHENDVVKVMKQEKYSPALLSQKIKEDMPKLERYIKDKEYRQKLDNSLYPYYNPELFDILGLEKIVKEKIGIPENATIKYEKVKCSKKCMHNHQYFYAYYWNSNIKKLRKKYIGKELPEPIQFKITYSIE